MSGFLLSNLKRKGVLYGRPYSTGLCWPISGKTCLSLLTGLSFFCRIISLVHHKHAGGQLINSQLGKEDTEVTIFKTGGFGPILKR